MQSGLHVHSALDMGIVNKSFDDYEPGLIRDVIQLHISKHYAWNEIFKE